MLQPRGGTRCSARWLQRAPGRPLCTRPASGMSGMMHCNSNTPSLAVSAASTGQHSNGVDGNASGPNSRSVRGLHGNSSPSTGVSPRRPIRAPAPSSLSSDCSEQGGGGSQERRQGGGRSGGGNGRGDGLRHTRGSDTIRGRGRHYGEGSVGTYHPASSVRGAKETKAPSAPLLNSWIKKTTSIEELEQLEEQHGSSFNHIHTAASFHQAASLVNRTKSGQAHPLMGRLWQRLHPQLHQCEPRQLSNIVWACGKVRFSQPALLNACLDRLVRGVGQASIQEISNAAYAAALLWDHGYRIDEGQVQQLVAALVQQRQAANPQNISNTLWASATMGVQLPEDQVQQLVAALVQQRQAAKPQAISNTVWALATMGVQLPEQQVQQLVAALVQQLQSAKPQELSNTLWGLATMGLQLPEGQVQQLVAALVQQQQAAKPQNISNTLWALATMGVQLPKGQVQQLVAALVQQRQAAKPQELSNTLWAVAKLADAMGRSKGNTASSNDQEVLMPVVLRLVDAVSQEQVADMTPQHISNSLWALSELRLRPDRLTGLLARAALQQVSDMNPQDISNTALALAKLGVHDALMFAALVCAAAEQRPQDVSTQDLCNLCWAVAVADQRQLSGSVIALCQEHMGDVQRWDSAVAEEHQQLYQVHLWLSDLQQQQERGHGISSGSLSDALSPSQLQQCAAAWQQLQQQRRHEAMQRKDSFQKRVFSCLQQLPGLSDCRMEALTEDGAFSVDVMALHGPSGRRLAIEADGPTHFLQPGRQPTGDTLARNRALAARGYVVVSVPWWESQAVQRDATAAEAAAYLSGKVHAALTAVGRSDRRSRTAPAA